MNKKLFLRKNSVSFPERYAKSEKGRGFDILCMRKVLCRRPLTWRSENLTSLFSRLDRKYERRLSQRSESMMIKRRDGPPPERKAPDDAPQFALL